ncbi:MAG: PorP/SprF family type IX secretion system membrane protein, partial [Bacteroidota bacterium]
QRIPVYNHYYNNPFLLNPAEIGSSGFLNAKINHRQQWRGIEGAPQVTTLTFEAPFDYKRGAVGGYLRSFERGLITTNDILVSYGYTAYLTKETTIHFGLSAGVSSNNINLGDIDSPDDPILAEFMNNNLQPIANFGFKFQSKSGLNFGVALPRLFTPSFLNQNSFESYEFSPFDEVLVSTYFKKKIEKKIVTKRTRGARRRVSVENTYAPLQIYLMYRYSKLVDERIEALATLNLTDNFWVGAAYRLNYGASGILGFNIKQFNFSYAYEPGSSQVTGFDQGSHEIQLGINIGERKKLQRSQPILRTVQKKESHEARFSQDDVEQGGSAGSDEETKVANKTFYVVLKAFRDFNSADDFVSREEKNGIYTDIFYNKADKRFYVYIFKTTKSKEANKQKKVVQDLTKYKTVRIIIVENK